MKIKASPIILIVIAYLFLAGFYLAQIIESPALLYLSVLASILLGVLAVIFSITNLVKRRNFKINLITLIISVPLIVIILVILPFILFFFSAVG